MLCGAARALGDGMRPRTSCLRPEPSDGMRLPRLHSSDGMRLSALVPRLRSGIRSERRLGIPRPALAFRRPLSRICSNLVKVGVVKTFQRRWFAYTSRRPCFRHIFAMDRRFILRELKIAGGMEIRVR